jgi:arabinofuranosyltransferase
VLFFTLAVLRRAWMCDDAFIMMRSVDNLVEGRGFVFNVGERVLGFTNPLWALLVAAVYSSIRNPYLTPVMLGVVVSAATAALLVVQGARDKRCVALVLVALCFSRAFVDFSTSGLENSLTHLLLVAYFFMVLRPQRAWLLKLSLIAALAIVNRPDLAVLVAPALVYAWWRMRRAGANRRVLLGFLPAIAWFGFALVYYGFPLPNTVYAKLNACIPTRELAQQGLAYLVDTVINDSMTAIIVVAALASLAFLGRWDKAAGVILLSMLLELTHIVVIGGDFMSGRFLTPSVAVSAVVLSHYGAQLLGDPQRLRLAAAAVAGILFSLSFSPFRDDPLREKKEIPKNRIANERAWYQDHLSLLVNLRPVAWKEDGLYADGRRIREKHQKVTVAGNLGIYSWGAGPEVHVIDNQALTDPLLARIPFSYSWDWRTGHLGRDVPPGYVETIEQGKNQLKDPCLRRYYDQLGPIIHGPVFTWARWKAIATLNLPGGITVRKCPMALEQDPPTVALR